jgi:hypothetical protein
VQRQRRGARKRRVAGARLHGAPRGRCEVGPVVLLLQQQRELLAAAQQVVRPEAPRQQRIEAVLLAAGAKHDLHRVLRAGWACGTSSMPAAWRAYTHTHTHTHTHAV